MSIDRLKILEKLSAGSIDAATAAVLLQDQASEAADAAQIIVEENIPEMEMDEEPVENEPAPTIFMEDEPIEPDELIEIEEDLPSKKIQQSRVRVIVTGKPMTANLNITLPISLLKFGAHIGAYFTPEIDGADWDNLNVHIDTGDQQVRIFTEEAV